VLARQRLLRIVAAVLLVEIALVAFGYGCLESLPAVGDAETRVRVILLVHRGVSSVLPPPERLAAAVVAIEDQHFYSNFVVDTLDGVGRAAR